MGSANWDWLSFANNDEINIVAIDRGFAAEMRTLFDDDLTQATAITADMWKMRSLKQKLRERFLLEEFIKVSRFDVQIVEEREAPDFVVRTGGALVGVEVTELFISHETHGNTPQAHEAISSQITTKAQ